MISQEARERFLADNLNLRLGALATNLARIVSFAKNIKATKSVEGLLDESICFIEWSAAGLLPDRVDAAARLVDIQRGLTHWQWNWNQVQANADERHKLAEQAQAWSDEVLKMSGLLDQE